MITTILTTIAILNTPKKPCQNINKKVLKVLRKRKIVLRINPRLIKTNTVLTLCSLAMPLEKIEIYSIVQILKLLQTFFILLFVYKKVYG